MDKLDYLVSLNYLYFIVKLIYYFQLELGVNAIEFMPLNQDHHSVCWGYDPMSLFAMHRQFGSLEELKMLIDACHKKKLAVIIDWIPNHVSPKNIFRHFDELDSHGSYFSSKIYL